MPDVLVAGGGPTGLLAAFELERAGLDVLVLERDAQPTRQSKALGLQPRSIEALEDRGLLAAVEPHVEARLPAGHFGVPDPDAAAVREFVTGLLAVPDARRAIALELSGIGITYPDTTGRAIDVPVALDGRAVLAGASLPAGWTDHVETRDGTKPQLVRPDGYVAWAGDRAWTRRCTGGSAAGRRRDGLSLVISTVVDIYTNCDRPSSVAAKKTPGLMAPGSFHSSPSTSGPAAQYCSPDSTRSPAPHSRNPEEPDVRR
jgi:choline dehydrogenase-like flavoprotein